MWPAYLCFLTPINVANELQTTGTPALIPSNAQQWQELRNFVS